MDGSANEFEVLMERVRAGCPEAAREVFDRYSQPVLLVVRRYLHERMRRQYDSVDFMQSVWAAFFQVPPDGYTFSGPDELVRFLSAVASHKVIDAVRQRFGAQRTLNRERSINDDTMGDKGELAAQLSMRTATPSQEAIAGERWENMLEGQPPAVREALEMLRQGHSQREVADTLRINPRLLRRVLHKLRIHVDEP